eukprot:g16217.t1
MPPPPLPFWRTCPPPQALRVNVGGKLLTNYLKELMQEVKDSLSYVSLDLDADLRAARVVKPGNPIVKEFVLPDRKSVLKGYARDVDWDARVKRRQQEDLGVEDEQAPQVVTPWSAEVITAVVNFKQ